MKQFVAVAAVAIAAATCAAPAFAQATLYRNTCTGSGCHVSSTTPDRFSRNGESVDTIRGVPRPDMQAALSSVSDTTLESIAAYIRAYNAGGTTASGKLTAFDVVVGVRCAGGGHHQRGQARDRHQHRDRRP